MIRIVELGFQFSRAKLDRDGAVVSIFEMYQN